MNKPSGPAWAIEQFQIWTTADPHLTKGFSLVTSDGPKNFYGTREQLLSIGQGLVKAADTMPKPS
jgi:hypothetical protein